MLGQIELSPEDSDKLFLRLGETNLRLGFDVSAVIAEATRTGENAICVNASESIYRQR
jgi:hypothetical protein